MTLNLSIPSETEVKLRERAQAAGQDVATFVLQAVADKLASAESAASLPLPDGDDWKRKLETCIDLHPAAKHPVDDSRESIYAGRGE